MGRKSIQNRRKEIWSTQPLGWSKYNVDGVDRGKPRPTGIGGVLRDANGATSLFYLESVGVRDSNEEQLLGKENFDSLGCSWPRENNY